MGGRYLWIHSFYTKSWFDILLGLSLALYLDEALEATLLFLNEQRDLGHDSVRANRARPFSSFLSTRCMHVS